MKKQTFVYAVLACAVFVTLVMTLGAGYVSYEHGLALAREGGETGLSAQIIPVLVDGLVLMSSGVLLAYKVRGRTDAPLRVWLLLGSGLVASFFANVVHGVHHHAFGVIVDGWPAYALAAAFEMLLLLIQVAHTATAPDTATEPVVQAVAPVVEQAVEPLPFDEPLEPEVVQDAPSTEPLEPELEELAKTTPLSEKQFVVHQYLGGMSARKIERVHGIDRRRAGRYINAYRKTQKTDDLISA